MKGRGEALTGFAPFFVLLRIQCINNDDLQNLYAGKVISY